MYLARFAVGTTDEDIDAASEDGGKRTCPFFFASLMLFEKFGSATPTQGILNTTTEQVPCFNVLEEEIPAGSHFVLSQCVDEVWVVECIFKDIEDATEETEQ